MINDKQHIFFPLITPCSVGSQSSFFLLNSGQMEVTNLLRTCLQQYFSHLTVDAFF